MANKDDDLVISVSTDLTTVRRQLRELGQSVTQSTSGVAKRFTDLGKQIDASMTPIQKRINGMVGIPVPTNIKEWTGALADVGKETDAVTKGFKLNRAGMMELKASGVNAFQALASGMSLARVAQMEGAQVIGAFAQGTEGLGTKFAALLTPTNLVVAGMVAAGAAVIAYGVSGGESIEKLDDILKAHKANIALLGDAYDKVAEKQQKPAVVSIQTAQLVNEGDVKKLQDKLRAEISNIYNGATEVMLSSTAGALSSETVVKSIFEPFSKAIEDLNNSAKDATALKSFTDIVTAIAAANPQYQTAAASLQDLADNANDVAQQLPGVAKAVDPVTYAFSQMQSQIDQINPDKASGRLKDVADATKALEGELQTGQLSLKEFDAAIDALGAANPDVSTVLDAIKSIGDEAAKARQQVAGLVNEGGKGDRLKSMDQAQAEYNTDLNMARRFGELSDLDTPKTPKSPAAARRPHLNPFDRGMQQSGDRTAELKAEAAALATVNPLVNDYGQALATATEKQKLINDAEKAHVALTPDVMKSIDQQAAAYGASVAALEKVRDSQQKLKEAIQETSDAARGFTSTFIDDMIDGKSATVALGDALKDLGKRLEELGLDQLFGGGSVGGGGAILGGTFTLNLRSAA